MADVKTSRKISRQFDGYLINSDIFGNKVAQKIEEKKSTEVLLKTIKTANLPKMLGKNLNLLTRDDARYSRYLKETKIRDLEDFKIAAVFDCTSNKDIDFILFKDGITKYQAGLFKDSKKYIDLCNDEEIKTFFENMVDERYYEVLINLFTDLINYLAWGIVISWVLLQMRFYRSVRILYLLSF